MWGGAFPAPPSAPTHPPGLCLLQRRRQHLAGVLDHPPRAPREVHGHQRVVRHAPLRGRRERAGGSWGAGGSPPRHRGCAGGRGGTHQGRGADPGGLAQPGLSLLVVTVELHAVLGGRHREWGVPWDRGRVTPTPKKTGMGAPPLCLCWIRGVASHWQPLIMGVSASSSIPQYPPVLSSTPPAPPGPHYTPNPHYRDPKYPPGGAGAHLEEAESRHPAGPALLILAAQQLQALGAAAHLVGLRGEDRTITGQPPPDPSPCPCHPLGGRDPLAELAEVPRGAAP